MGGVDGASGRSRRFLEEEQSRLGESKCEGCELGWRGCELGWRACDRQQEGHYGRN